LSCLKAFAKIGLYHQNRLDVNILLIDDSAIVRRGLRSLLEQHTEWIVCGEAANGREGLDKAQELRPDLIIIDLVMPIMNGIEASRMFKRLMPNIPLLMFTTFSSPYLCKEAMAAGVYAVIDKSDGAATLVDNIQKLLSPPASAA
jgi:DNA-binding NarL/FixJ family response regulator